MGPLPDLCSALDMGGGGRVTRGVKPHARKLRLAAVFALGIAGRIGEAMMLAGLRHLNGYARATEWSGPHGRNLIGSNVTILGGGGNDVLTGDTGSDIVRGEAGTDYVYGGTGSDFLYGGPSGDMIVGVTSGWNCTPIACRYWNAWFSNTSPLANRVAPGGMANPSPCQW